MLRQLIGEGHPDRGQSGTRPPGKIRADQNQIEQVIMNRGDQLRASAMAHRW